MPLTLTTHQHEKIIIGERDGNKDLRIEIMEIDPKRKRVSLDVHDAHGLTKKRIALDEIVELADGIDIKLREIFKNEEGELQVKLSIKAPEHVPIDPEHLFHKKAIISHLSVGETAIFGDGRNAVHVEAKQCSHPWIACLRVDAPFQGRSTQILLRDGEKAKVGNVTVTAAGVGSIRHKDKVAVRCFDREGGFMELKHR